MITLALVSAGIVAGLAGLFWWMGRDVYVEFDSGKKEETNKR